MPTIVQTGNLSPTERAWSAFLGASLSLLAVRRGHPVLRSIGATVGAALIARAIAGHCGVKAALIGTVSLRDGLRDQWHCLSQRRTTIQHGLPGSPVHTARSHAVDTSVLDSFPASDPPASRLKDEPPVNAEAKWEAEAARRAKGAGDDQG